MKKFVFFLETYSSLQNEAKTFLAFAKALAQGEEYEVFYINHAYKEDEKTLEGTNVRFVPMEEFREKEFEGAFFFTALNQLCNLLVHIQTLKESKIVLYVYDENAGKWLLGNLNDAEDNHKTLEKLKEYNSIAYACQRFSPCEKGDNVLFLACDTEEKDVYYRKELAKPGEINVAFCGTLDMRSIFGVYNIIQGIESCGTDKDVTLHVIGSTQMPIYYNVANMSKGVSRVVYLGAMEKDEREKYIEENVDLVFSTVSVGAEIVSCGVPVATTFTGNQQFFKNEFAYLFETEGKAVAFLEEENESYHTMEELLKDIYDDGRKASLAEKCYEFVVGRKGKKERAKRIAFLSEETELTVKKCLEMEQIGKRIAEFNTKKDACGGSFNELLKKERSNGKEAEERVKKLLAVQKSYSAKAKEIKKKYRKEKKIKVAFIVVFKSVFTMAPVFEKMSDDPVFDPYIIVAPDVSDTMRYQKSTYRDTYSGLKELYGDRVIGGFEEKNETYYELKDEYPVVLFMNPYASLVHPYHHIDYFADKNVLTMYASYGFGALNFWDNVIRTDFYNMLWKACVESEENMRYLESKEAIKGLNGIVTGYMKMDKLALLTPEKKERKRVLICPHHTVWGDKTLNISNFLRFSELFVRLPKMFPQVDFVFRPHPLLVKNILLHNVWTQSELDDYFNRLLSSPNMEYDTSGDYMQKFLDSDAMIHDCGSFIGEYLYTEKPCMYMIRDKEETYKTLVPFGASCMDRYYLGKEEQDIVDFIEKVVIGGDDPMKEDRERFVREKLKVNYPHATDVVIWTIKDALGIKE